MFVVDLARLIYINVIELLKKVKPVRPSETLSKCNCICK